MTKSSRLKNSNKSLFCSFKAAFESNTAGITKEYILVYSLLFLVVAALVYIPFIIRGKSLIWEVDGLSQHYLALMYIGQWFREIFRNIFMEHTFSVPLWDFGIGAGGDVLTTFNYYGLGDPLCLLSVFVPEEYTVHLYNFLIVLRLYLSGLFFSLFCFRVKQRGFETMFGAFAYVFSGYALYAGSRHPFFLMPMVCFPLMLLGAEKILSKESPILFISIVFLSFLSNFYFSYMLVILTVIYVAARFFTVKENRNIKTTAITVGKFLLSGTVGVMMSCAVLIPVLIVFLGNDRSGVERSGFNLLNDFKFYSSFFSSFMSYSTPGTWTMTGFAPVSLIALVVLFRKKGEYLYLKILVAVFTLMLMIPAVSKFMNGFAYEANRWVWGYAFLLSFIGVVLFRSLLAMSRKEKLTLVVFAGVYLILSAVVAYNYHITMVLQYAIFAFLVMLFVLAKELSDKKGRRILKGTVAVLSVASVVINAFCCYSAEFSDYIYEFIDTNKAYALVDNSVSKKMKDEMSEEFCRFEQIENTLRNAPVVDGTNGVAFYWSLCDNYIGEYLKDSGAVRYTTYNFQHLYKFTALDSLFSVKYFFTDKPEANVPYGYEYVKDIKTVTGTFSVYENKYHLPLGFTYSDYITRDEYMKLGNAQRQETLLKNVLLEEGVEGLRQGDNILTSYEIPFEIVATDGAQVDGNKITTLKKDATITLNFKSVEDCELYLSFTGLNCDDYLDKEEVLEHSGKWNKMTFTEKLAVKKEVLYSRDIKEFTFRINSLEYTPKFTLSTPNYQNYDGIHDFLVNLGYTDKERDTITLEISHPGEYSFDEMKVLVQPMDNYVENVTQRAEHTLENIEINDNSFSGDIALTEPQLLFVSVPYSKGFKAYVNGEEAEILRANTWGMALPLAEGEHHIEFKYHTCGLSAGIVVSAVGFAAFGAIAFMTCCKRKKSASKIK